MLLKKCRVHNEELVYCKDCVEFHKTLNTREVLRLSDKEKKVIYQKTLRKLKKYEQN